MTINHNLPTSESSNNGSSMRSRSSPANSEQDAELADVEEPFGLLYEFRTDEADEGQQHDDAGREPLRSDGARQPGEEAAGVVGERAGVERHNDDVAQDEQRIEPSGKAPVSEDAIQERHRAALARIRQRESHVGVGRQERYETADEKGKEGCPARLGPGEPEGGEDAAAHDAADAD